MNIYSQNNPTWASILLGFSKTTTIGSDGCTISCVGMAAGLSPAEVNRRLVEVKGYALVDKDKKAHIGVAGANLIIWGSIVQAIPWLEFEWRGYTYDNARVLKAIADYGFCLIEVDAAPIKGVKHWVLAIGGGEILDPFDGKKKPFSTYTPLGFAVIKRISSAEPKEPNSPATNPDTWLLHNSDQWRALCWFLNMPKTPEDTDFAEVKTQWGLLQSKLDATLSDYRRLEEQSKNIGNVEMVGPDGQSRPVSWYIAEWFNREEQVGRLKLDIQNYYHEAEVAKSETVQRDSVIDDLRSQINNLNKQRGETIQQLTEQNAELINLRTQLTEYQDSEREEVKRSASDLDIADLLAVIVSKVMAKLPSKK